MRRRVVLALLLLFATPAGGSPPQLASVTAVLSRFTALLGIRFAQRSLVPDSLQILHDLEKSAGDSLQKEYVGIVGKMLLVRNPEIVGHSDFRHSPHAQGPWSLPTLLRRTFQATGAGKGAEAQLSALGLKLGDFGGAWTRADPSRNLDSMPLRLLAIVNRLDLAKIISKPGHAVGVSTCPPGMLCGGELHLVYAAPPSTPLTGSAAGPYFTFILEFVLPPLSKAEFFQVALQWTEQILHTDANESRQSLETLLGDFFSRWSRGPGEARIRLNLRNGAVWTFSQYAIGSQGVTGSPLNRQPRIQPPAGVGGCVTADSALGRYLAVSENRKGVLASNYDYVPPQTKCLPAFPAECFGTINAGPANTLTVSPGIVSNKKLERVRFSLSLNSCTGCHGMETHPPQPADPANYSSDTQFDQVRYPLAETGPATLSRFLTGSSADGDPSLFEAWKYTPHYAAPCGTPATEAYRYNDLLRRFVFHLAVLDLSPAALVLSKLKIDIVDKGINYTWEKALELTGLTAFQPH